MDDQQQQEQQPQQPQPGEILTPQDIIATIQIFVFSSGKATIRTENLGPLQAARIMSIMTVQMITQSLEPKQIVTP